MRAMFQLLLLFGFSTTAVCLSRRYHFITEKKTWSEAQRYCRENYVDLASVDNAEEELALIKTTDIRISRQTWIGLYDDPTSWKWSLANDDAFYTEGERNFTNWYVQKPMNWNGNHLCAFISSYTGVWYPYVCSAQMLFICFDGRTNASQKYVPVYQYKNWSEAQGYCREHHTDLASVRSEAENQEMRFGLFKSFYYYYDNLWIGLYRTRSWSDKSNSSFSNWKPGEPDNYAQSESCTAVSFNTLDSGYWTDENCNQMLPFLCYNKTSSAHVYRFVNATKTWPDAQRFCRENYTDLATINTMEEMTSLLQAVNASYLGLAWIGLYDDLDSWRWSLDDDGFYQEGERMYRGWYHEPDNYNGKELCAYIRSDGTWGDGDCGNPMPFVCYDGRNGTDGYVWVNQYMDWTRAQRYCRQRHKDLASVRSQADNSKILQLSGGSQAWIGLYRSRLWSDRHDSTYENWRQASPYIPEQPDNGVYSYWESGNQHCTVVSLDDSGQWADEDCLATFPFICYNKHCTGSSCTIQYHYVTENKTWTEAQSYCRENYTDLATITNMADMENLLDAVYGKFPDSAWIGLYDDLTSWKWSLDDALFYKSGEKDFSNWYIYKPPTWTEDNMCAYFSPYYMTWWDIYCYQILPFICFDGRRNASETYVYISQYMNWYDAQRYCREHYTDLVSVRSETENQKIRRSVRDYYNIAWIGLYRTSWSWSDNSSYVFSNWNPGQPYVNGGTKNCTAAYTGSGKWTEENCNTTFPFFCYTRTSSTSHQYHFITENKTWTEAQTYCRGNYTDLATVNQTEDMDSLLGTVKSNYTGLAWIGLYADPDDWRWSLEDDAYYKAGERDFRGWHHQPDNYNGKEMCVSMSSNGKWFDRPCAWTLGFVCFNGMNNTYVWISMTMTWEEAQRYCRVNHTDLASVRNETELQLILNVTQGSDVWIGLYRNRLWSDQSNSTFTYWRPEIQRHYIAEPDNGLYSYRDYGMQHCTALDSSGKWTDENCYSSFPFFCYSATLPGAVIGLRMKVTVRGNMPESQIKELVLKELKRELIRLGMPKNIMLKVRNIWKISP